MSRRKKGRGRVRLEELIKPELPPEKPEVIKVEAKPMRQPSAFQSMMLPRYDEEDDDDVHLPFFGNMGPAPAEMTYKVQTEGDDGYQDQRGFTYSEKDGKFQVQMVFRAEGPGRVPPGFKALSVMKDLMNFAFNQIAGGGIVNQKIEQDAKPAPPPPDAPLHQRVLGYLTGNGDRPCL
jgi:hypothetical protein